MDFSREPWRRQYVNESVDHKAKPLLARGLRDYLIRIARQEDGVLVKNEATVERAIETLLRGCGAHEDEFAQCVKYIKIWIDDGYLTVRTRNGRCNVVILRYLEAQNAKSPAAIRQQRYRENKKKKKEAKRLESQQLSLVQQNVTRNVTGNVTGNVTNDATVTLQRKKERKKERGSKDPIRVTSPVTEKARQWSSSPDGPMTHGPPHLWPEVQQVLDCADTVWNRNSRVANSGDPRVLTIMDRFCEGFSVDDLCDAIRGSGRDEFIATRPSLQSVKTLLKDAAAVDKYASLLEAPASKAPSVQPPAGSYYERTGFEDAAGRGPVEQDPPDDPFGKAAADG